MATYTISSNTNIDALTSKAGGDIYNISGATLTIDQDSRYGLNQTTSTTLGNITVSATLGGSVTFNAAAVRLIPYNTGLGVVPAAGTTITQGSASGILIGVYSALNVAPTAAAAAMPASGYIKIKQWNSVAFAAGLITTGITVTATGADTAGWIEISGDDGSSISMPRLGNQSTNVAQGAWYELGTTDGNRATTYQIPSNGLLQYHAGVFVETAVSSGVFEFYPIADTTAVVTNIGTEAVRGKFCWISTAGVLRFGHDGTNSTGGYIPATGLKVRIGNIFFACNTTAARTANVEPNATLATRYAWSTGNGGNISMDKVSHGWYAFFSLAYGVTLTNSGFLSSVRPQRVVTTVTMTRVGIAQHVAFATSPCQFFGIAGTFTDCVFSKSPYGSNGYPLTLTNAANCTFTRCSFITTGPRTNTTVGSTSIGRSASLVFTSCVFSSQLNLTNCDNVTLTSSTFFDVQAGTTITGSALYGVVMTGGSNIVIDGWSHGGLVGVAAYSGFLRFGQSSTSGVKLRNIGTIASPLDLGYPAVDDVAWTRVTTTATVTSTAHGMKTGDTISVYMSSSTAAVTVAVRTITVVDANTYTFTCLNAGAASGTLSYHGAIAANILTYQNDTYAPGIKFQRCYFTGVRTGPLISGASDNLGLTLDNCDFHGDNLTASVIAENNVIVRSFEAIRSRTAQPGIYGYHFADMFTQLLPANLSALAWTRSTTTATVTSASHKLRTGDLINVTVSSDTAAIILGQKTVTVIDSSTFTFTCLNAGGASGTLTMSPLNGQFIITMNEATSSTTSQITFNAGTPKFTAAGTIAMNGVGDQVTWETPDYVLGHLNFPWAQYLGGGTDTNYKVEYAINTGSGYGAFHSLNRTQAGSSGTSAGTSITVTDSSVFEVGDYVFTSYSGPFAKITNIPNSTTLTVDVANASTGSGTIRWNHLPSESNNPSTGFKMKVRITTTVANTEAITYIGFYTFWNATTKAYTYTLDPTILTFTGLVSGSDIRVMSTGTTTSLLDVDANSGTTYAYTYDYVAGTIVDIQVLKDGYIPFVYHGYTLGSSAATFLVSQVADRNEGS